MARFGKEVHFQSDQKDLLPRSSVEDVEIKEFIRAHKNREIPKMEKNQEKNHWF